MKIAVAAANGRVAKKVIAEALSRGHEVVAFGRHEENDTGAAQYIKKDIFDLTREDLAGFDVVVDAAGGWNEETFPVIRRAAEHLCGLLAGTPVRLLVVGGAGSLFVNAEHTLTVAETPDFPEAFKGVADAHQKALDFLRTVKDTDWTYISPAGDFQADGERTGHYLLGGEELLLNSRGESIISYADYAVAVLDEVEKGKEGHIRQRISVVRA
jgi:putative NADH-flavin reductase